MLSSLSIILLFGFLLSGLLNKFKLPGIIGMLIAGMILGPYGLNLIHPSILSISKELRQIALVIILLRAGLAMDIQDLKAIGLPALFMTFVPASFELVAIMLLAPLLLGLSLLDAALLGAILAAVSPAIVIPRMLKLLEDPKVSNKQIPHLIMAGSSVDDVYVIVVFTALLSLSLGNSVSISQFLNVPFAIILGILVGAIIGVGSVIFFKRFHIRDTVKVLILLSLSFLFVDFENKYGKVFPFSAYIAVISMGAIILHKYGVLAQRISLKFNKAWVASELLLFVLVGSSVDLSLLSNIGLNSIVLVVLALVVRSIGVFISLLPSQFNIKEKIYIIFSYLPKATVQAAIGGIPLSLGIASGSKILAVSVLAILITAPIGASLMDHSLFLIHKKEA